MLGTGNALVTEVYNTCFVIENENQYLLVDGGGGSEILKRLKDAKISIADIHHIFVTHKHIDHILGIVWMTRIICQNMQKGAYEGDAYIYGHEEVISLIQELSEKLLQKKQTDFIGKRVHLVVVTDGEEKENSGNVQNADTEAKEADSSDRSERVWFDGHRILLAEDNELNREIAYELLTETGLIVDTVKDGQEAVEALEKHPALYELVFMDIQMPRMNGYEAARTIRTLPAEWLRKIPIIAMTANVFQEDLEKAIDSGMNGHVTKPIDMNAVCEVLKKWLFRHDS